MNDIAAVTGQLARLRESLQQKQQELDGMATFSDAERTRSIQFIGKLTQAWDRLVSVATQLPRRNLAPLVDEGAAAGVAH